MIIDRLVNLYLRPGYPAERENPAVVRFTLARLWRSGQWVMERTAGGRLLGWMAWIRTNELGAALIRQFGWDGLMYLSIPIAMTGPYAVIMYHVSAQSRPSIQTVGKLFRRVEELNRDAPYIASFYARRGSNRWAVRKNRSYPHER